MEQQGEDNFNLLYIPHFSGLLTVRELFLFWKTCSEDKFVFFAMVEKSVGPCKWWGNGVIKIMWFCCGSVGQDRESSDRNHSEHQRIWRSFEEQWQLKFRKKVVLLTGYPPIFIGELVIFQSILYINGKDRVFYTRWDPPAFHKIKTLNQCRNWDLEEALNYRFCARLQQDVILQILAK